MLVGLVINEDIHVELLELLELYCELLLARFGLLDQKYVLSLVILCRSISKSVPENQIQVREHFQYTVVFTYRSHVSKVSAKGCVVSYTPRPGQNSKVEFQRYHLPSRLGFTPPLELHVLRDILMHKYGREFSLGVMENHDGCVSDRVGLPLLLP